MSATTKNWNDDQSPRLAAADANGFKQENNNLIAGSGQSLNTSDNQQTHKAIAFYSSIGSHFQGGGSTNAYTANAVPPRINPPARVEGMVVQFQAPAANTGACTLNAFGTGFMGIALRGGAVNPRAGDISPRGLTTVIYRGFYWELVRLGMAIDTIVNFSNAAWLPQPDTKTIRFQAAGGGGAGGGTPALSGTQSASAQGGGGGAYKSFTTSIIDTSYAITIGAGGSGVGANSGNNGGSTIVSSTSMSITAGGGEGGAVGTASSGAAVVRSFSQGRGGTPSGNGFSASGESADFALCIGEAIYILSNGGGNYFGGGSRSDASSTNQSSTPGAGGHGNAHDSLNISSTTTAKAGASGNKGVVLVTEWL